MTATIPIAQSHSVRHARRRVARAFGRGGKAARVTRSDVASLLRNAPSFSPRKAFELIWCSSCADKIERCECIPF